MIWESARPYLYVRTTADSRIVAGGEDVEFVDEEKRDRLLPGKTRTLQRKVRKMFRACHGNWRLPGPERLRSLKTDSRTSGRTGIFPVRSSLWDTAATESLLPPSLVSLSRI